MLSTAGQELWILDTEPTSPSYLQTVDRTAIPELNPGLNSLTGVRMRGDGRMAFALLRERIAAGADGVQRYDVIGRRWIDHNAAVPGIQPIGPLSSPPGPIVQSRDFDIARDGSFGTLTDYDALVRIEFDREDPDAWRLVRLPGAWLPSALIQR